MVTTLLFIPHGHCYLWRKDLVMLHLLSDMLIAVAYFSIPLALVYFVQKRQDLPYPSIFKLFGAFIIACGITHVFEIWTLWHPNYWTSGLLKAVTAIISIVTAVTLIKIIPEALTIPSRAELENAKKELEQRVQERTQALQVSEERLQMALSGSGDGLWDWDIVQGTVYLSPQWQTMLGYEPEELVGHVNTWESLIHPDEYDSVMEILGMHLENSQKPYSFDYRMKMKSGEWKWIGNYGQVVSRNAQGEPLRMVGTHKDITERKEREQKLSESLQEKSVMLQEIHHRVKNNLQVICSLLNLQTISGNQYINNVIKECQNRVKSMALVHENLYRSENLSKINLESYIQSLSNNLLRSYCSKATQTKIRLNISELFLNLDIALPCGLIINEIVSNALKYAFPDNQPGQVDISLAEGTNQELVLTIADNGVGLPPEINVEETNTMGLRMVRILTQQISGQLKIERELGTSFQVIFPQISP